MSALRWMHKQKPLIKGKKLSKSSDAQLLTLFYGVNNKGISLLKKRQDMSLFIAFYSVCFPINHLSRALEIREKIGRKLHWNICPDLMWLYISILTFFDDVANLR